MGDTFWFLPLPFETLRWLAATYPCLVDFVRRVGDKEMVMLDYGFFGRTLGPLGEAMDFVIYWLATGGRMMPPA